MGLPFGTATFPNVLAQGGKDGRIFLLNRSALGGRKQGPGQSNSDFGSVPVGQTVTKTVHVTNTATCPPR